MTDETKNSPVEVTLDESPSVEVELSDKKAEVKEPVVETKKPDAREQALEDMRRQYENQKRIAEAEREARRQAEMFARRQAQEVGYARNEVQDSNLRIILNAIEANQQAAEMVEHQLAEALASGDYNVVAKAQRQLAQYEAELLQLNNGKNQLEEMLQAQTAEGAVYEPQIPSFEPQIPQDPVEQYASQLSPKSAQWLREHPEAVNKIDRLGRAHQEAIEDGYAPDTKEYFNYIETRLGYAETPKRAAPNKKAMVSAPVSSSGSGISSRSGSPTTITLSPEEVEMAELNEPGLPRNQAIEIYARNKMALIREGKLSA